jgi:hypothetical protein
MYLLLNKRFSIMSSDNLTTFNLFFLLIFFRCKDDSYKSRRYRNCHKIKIMYILYETRIKDFTLVML